MKILKATSPPAYLALPHVLPKKKKINGQQHHPSSRSTNSTVRVKTQCPFSGIIILISHIKKTTSVTTPG